MGPWGEVSSGEKGPAELVAISRAPWRALVSSVSGSECVARGNEPGPARCFGAALGLSRGAPRNPNKFPVTVLHGLQRNNSTHAPVYPGPELTGGGCSRRLRGSLADSELKALFWPLSSANLSPPSRLSYAMGRSVRAAAYNLRPMASSSGAWLARVWLGWPLSRNMSGPRAAFILGGACLAQSRAGVRARAATGLVCTLARAAPPTPACPTAWVLVGPRGGGQHLRSSPSCAALRYTERGGPS